MPESIRYIVTRASQQYSPDRPAKPVDGSVSETFQIKNILGEFFPITYYVIELTPNELVQFVRQNGPCIVSMGKHWHDYICTGVDMPHIIIHDDYVE